MKRCDECGSWDKQCMADEPVEGCGCVRCAGAELAKRLPIRVGMTTLQAERILIEATLAANNGNELASSKILDIDRKTLRDKKRRYREADAAGANR